MTKVEQRVRDAVLQTSEPKVIPEWSSVVRRGGVVKRRRRMGRTLAAFSVVVAGAVVIVLATNDSESANRSIVATPSPSTAPPSMSAGRPVLDGCTPTNAFETVVKGTSFLQAPDPASPPFVGEVFADPTRGVSGPLAIFIRQPSQGLGLVANAQINGRDANVQMGQNLQGGAMWQLGPGEGADLYSRGLTEDEIRLLAEQLDSGGSALPQNLASIGMTDVASKSTSVCDSPQGQVASITEIHGSQPSRYAEAMNGGPRRFDVGDTTFAISGGAPGLFDVANATYHEATADEWRTICQSHGSRCASETAGTTTTTAP